MSQFDIDVKIITHQRVVDILQNINSGKFESVLDRYPKSTIYSDITMLKTMGLVERSSGKYRLTSAGSAILHITRNFFSNLNTLSRLIESFPVHRISFPEEFYARLHELEESNPISLIFPEDFDINKTCMKKLRGSEKVRFLFSEVDYRQLNFFLERLRNSELELVINRYGNFNRKSNLKVFRATVRIDIGLIVSEKCLIVVFRDVTGNYDFSRALFSEDKRSIKFGFDLFDYYRDLSEMV
jgi:predicted transcriptional regulator